MDADEAGRQAAQSLAGQYGETAQIVTLPAGKDVSEYIHQHNGDLAGLLASASVWWPRGVPDSYRRAMLRYLRPSTAPVIELVNAAALQECSTADSPQRSFWLRMTRSDSVYRQGTVRSIISYLSRGLFQFWLTMKKAHSLQL
jgi:hypothetical protein